MKVSENARIALDAALIEGDKLTLQGQLDRKVYTETNKVIEALGGKWNRSAKAHIIPPDFAEGLDAAMITGEVVETKKELQQFFTPKRLAVTLVLHAEVKPGMLALEPSVGQGALLDELLKEGADVSVFEVDDLLRAKLTEEHIDNPRVYCLGKDFMAALADPVFDRVVMNPPFTRQQDVDHVSHALDFLKPGGILTAITSPSWRYRENAKSVAFRKLLADTDPAYLAVDVAAGEFKASGTMVSTVMLKVRKPA